MYMLTDEPEGSGALATAFRALDNAFGTEEFAREDAAITLSQAGVSGNAFDKLVSGGYVSEV